MAIWIPEQRDQLSAVDQFNEYRAKHADVLDEYEAKMLTIFGDEDDDEDPRSKEERVKALENDPKYFRHVQEMSRLTSQLRFEDASATREAARTNTGIEIDPYWSTVVDHTHKLNSHYEKKTRSVFDIGRGVRHKISKSGAKTS